MFLQQIGYVDQVVLGVYFERTVDTSFNVIYLVDDLLRMTWHTNNFTNAAGKYQVKILTSTLSSGSSVFHTECLCVNVEV